MRQGTVLMIWGHLPLDEAVFEFNIARGHFLTALSMAVSMECTSVAQETTSFPLIPSLVRLNDTAFFSMAADTGTVSGDSCRGN